MKKALGIGMIGIGILFLAKAYANVVALPDAFSGSGVGAGENYDSGVVALTIFFAVGGIALILYGIGKIKEVKQEGQDNPPSD